MMLLTKTSQKNEYTTRKNINKKITAAFKRITERNGENKSKINYLLEGTEGWTPGQPKSYMLRLGRTQASTIFKARTRMLHVKNNYKNTYKNLACRACKKTRNPRACTSCLPSHPQRQHHNCRKIWNIHGKPQRTSKNCQKNSSCNRKTWKTPHSVPPTELMVERPGTPG